MRDLYRLPWGNPLTTLTPQTNGLAYLKGSNKVASNLKTMEFPQEAPPKINIPWGDPAKPSVFVAVMQNRTAPKETLVVYDVKSPLIDVDNGEVHLTFQKPLSKYTALIMKVSYEKNGEFYNYERILPDSMLTEFQLLGYLRIFWKKNREMLKHTLIAKGARVASDLSEYQVDPLLSKIRNQEVRNMKVASNGTDIMWGDPPKPNVWNVEKLPWKPNTGGGEYYVIRSPLMEGALLAHFDRVQGIDRDDMYVTIRDGENYTDRVIAEVKIHNGVPHLARIDKNYGTWLTELWRRSRTLQDLVRSRLKPNIKLASNLSQYQIDPRFVKPAPKKMTRTAGEVRFVKDNSNDASSWAWGDTGASERRIPADFVFKKNAQKALAKTMRSSLSAMGHALSAYHTFTKIKSADVSPDGALGGRGYIQKVAHMRRAYMNVAEALSALSDTIYDEINAPHWNDAGTPKEVKEIIEEAEEIREDPEAWAEEQENSKDESES